MKHFKTITACDCSGKELGEVRLRKAGTGCAVAEVVAYNGEVFKLMTFTRSNAKSRWTNDKTPTHCTNKQRLDAAVNFFYYDTETVKKVAAVSGYDSHEL